MILLPVLLIFLVGVAHGQYYILDEQFNGAPSLPAGFTGTGTFGSNSSTNNYGRNAPSLQFLTDGQKFTYGPWTAAADAISFYHKTNSGGGALITIEESADGSSWTTLGVCTIITTSATWEGMLNSASRYVRFSASNITSSSRPYVDDLRIRSATNSCTGNFELVRALINGNCAQCEDANEWVDFFTGDQPLNISYFELVNPYVVPTGSVGGAYGGNGPGNNLNVKWMPGSSYSAYQFDYINNLNLLSGCTVFVPVPTNNIIPANSRVIAITGSAPDATYNLSDMCGLGVVYVMFSSRNICPTSSGKYANASCSSNCSRYLSIFNHLTACYDVRAYIASPVTTSTGGLYVFQGSVVGYVGIISCLALTLPSTFLSVTGFNSERGNELFWTVNEESEVLYYEVERSFNGRDFVLCADQTSYPETGVNNYQILDQMITAEAVTYYRIAMIGTDGSREYSDIVAIEKLESWNVSLNLASQIMVFAPAACVAELTLLDVTGRVVSTLQLNVDEGRNVVDEITVPLGIHCCVIHQNNHMVLTKRIFR